MALPPVDELKSTLEQLLPGVSLTVEGDALLVAPKDVPAVCRSLKEAERFGLDYLANLTATDYPPDLSALPAAAQQQAGVPHPGTEQAGRIELVYHLCSMAQKHGPVTLLATLDRANPVIESVTPIWRGAEYQEREIYDLFGVTFTGHPDLRRILMWDGFEGHPMRKDYVVEDQGAGTQ